MFFPSAARPTKLGGRERSKTACCKGCGDGSCARWSQGRRLARRRHGGGRCAAAAARVRAAKPAGEAIEVREPIGLGHKVALADIAPGEPVRKYGQIIGFASKAIPAGSLVHVHNLKADLFERDYAFATEKPTIACAGGAKDVSRIPPARRPGRHAELHRRDQHRELLGEHLALRRRPIPG